MSNFSFSDQFTIYGQRYLNTKGWICEISFPGNKNNYDGINNADEKISLIMNSLFLLKPGNSKFRLLKKTIDNPFLNFGVVSSIRVVNSGIGDKIFLSEEDIISFKSIHKSIQRIYHYKKYKQLRLAFRRLNYAANSSHHTDKIVDLVIALESLIASDTPALETTYRFKLRIASLIDHKYGSSSRKN